MSKDVQKLENVGQAIAELRGFVPADVQQRYFVGPVWEQIESLADKPLDQEVDSALGVTAIRILMANYLLNVVGESLDQEIMFGKKVDMQTYALVELEPAEIEEIRVIRRGINDFVERLFEKVKISYEDIEVFLADHIFEVESEVEGVFSVDLAPFMMWQITEAILELQKSSVPPLEIQGKRIVIKLYSMYSGLGDLLDEEDCVFNAGFVFTTQTGVECRGSFKLKLPVAKVMKKSLDESLLN